MAKSEAAEGDGDAVVVVEEELRRELQRLARAIAVDGDCRGETLDRAAGTIAAIRTAAKAASVAGGGRGRNNRRSAAAPGAQGRTTGAVVPEHFVCPISGELMRDPVVVATGQTYDRPFIQAWLNAGNRTCPKTQQVLSHSIITANHLVRRMISEWCKTNGIDLPPVDNSEGNTVTQGERYQLECLLEKISFPSIAEQEKAAKELRLLTKRTPSFRALLGEKPDAIPKLLSLLSSPDVDEHPELQEDVVTTILNLSIHDNNKKVVGDNTQAIPLLIDALKAGRMETRGNAAAALFTLSALDDNKHKIGELGAMSPLFKLYEQGSTIAKKDASCAIFNLCLAPENKARAIGEGAVRVLLKSIVEATLVDESLAILAMLSSNQQAVEEICGSNGVPCMLGIIRDNDCGRNRENAAVILYSVCMYDRSKLREVRVEENRSACISLLAKNGTSRARRKATGILERLNRTRDAMFSCGTP